MAKKTIDDVSFKGLRTFVRCDFNVPLNDAGEITNDLRIANALPTIKKLIADGGKVILSSHLGRPKGEKNAKFSLAPVAARLTELLGQDVKLLDDCIGSAVEAEVAALGEGQVVLLENVRFHAAETSKDEAELKAFSAELAKLADIFVLDAFGTAHRAQASVVGLAAHVEAVSGYLLAKELEYFGKILDAPEKPVVAVLGGAKVSDKIQLIENMLDKVDKVIVGGGMAYTFQYGQGRKVGNSLLEKDYVELAMSLIEKAKAKGVELILPVDTVIADDFSATANTQVVSGDIPDGWEGIDVGPEAVKQFNAAVADAKVVVWNGPLGVFEIEPFSHGTRGFAEVVANLNATTIIGGGDTATAIAKFGLDDKVSHVSTGGGASLELLEGKVLPGVACLAEK
ncbi:MAG: phosphoglycerate kinase [Lentisphaeraceae bacterium]|nr:phosphoglycerate kinase [Lentisphaeraceae bacterium]